MMQRSIELDSKMMAEANRLILEGLLDAAEQLAIQAMEFTRFGDKWLHILANIAMLRKDGVSSSAIVAELSRVAPDSAELAFVSAQHEANFGSREQAVNLLRQLDSERKIGPNDLVWAIGVASRANDPLLLSEFISRIDLTKIIDSDKITIAAAAIDCDATEIASQMIAGFNNDESNLTVARIKASVAVKNEQYGEARSIVIPLLQMNPNHSHLLRLASMICENTNQLEQAIDLAQRECQITPLDPKAWLNLARIQLKSHLHIESIHSTSRALQLHRYVGPS